MTHAYLILAHNEFPLLTRLVSALDHPGNSLYIHIDQKVGDDVFAGVKAGLEGAVKQASLAFTAERVDIVWGDFSMVEAELLLLREASATHHDYYHLLSGTDLPIRPHGEITRFFEENAGKEFIRGHQYSPRSSTGLRMRYYFPFQHTVGHHYLRPLGMLQWLLLLPQAMVGVNRLRKLPKGFYKGQQWFSVTHAFVADLLAFYGQEENLRPYRKTLIPDESFVQMFAYHSQYSERIYMQKCHWGPACNNMRLVGWTRRFQGSPGIYTIKDVERLMGSCQLWARKFSFEKHPDAVEAVLERIGAQPK